MWANAKRLAEVSIAMDGVLANLATLEKLPFSAHSAWDQCDDELFGYGTDSLKAVCIQGVISTFVIKRRQARYIELLSTVRGVKKIRQSLAHFADFDAKFLVSIAPGWQTPSFIEARLREYGAPQRCAVFAEFEDADGENLLLRDALESVFGRGLGAVICCGPNLAYYEGEERGDRFILRK